MTPDEIRLVQTTFAQVETIAEQAADIFYRRLFEVAPAVEPMFSGDMRAQGRMLMSSLRLVVRGLGKPEVILPAVQAMGERHAGYGAQPAHYVVVGDVLLWTLERGLGDAFTPDVRAAWAKAYTLLSGLMIDAQKAAGRVAAASV